MNASASVIRCFMRKGGRPLSRRKKKAESHQPQVLLKPAEIKAVLDEYVIGQDDKSDPVGGSL